MEKRVLIARWLGSDVQPIPIYDEASVSTARQRVRETGQQLSLAKEIVENVALIASEITHNQLHHARQGYFAVKPIQHDNVKGLEVIAADIGPGIKKPSLVIQDNHSTVGTLGAGVGAVCRLADEVVLVLIPLLVLAAGQFQRQRVRVETVKVQPGSVLLMFTDGLKSRTTLKGKLDLLRESPIVMAEHLLENESRPDDDALVLIVRFPR